MTTTLAFAATAFGILMGASPLLQALRAHNLRSSREISLPFLFILAMGSTTWLLYGIAISNAALIIANSVGTAAWWATLLVALYWRRHQPK